MVYYIRWTKQLLLSNFIFLKKDDNKEAAKRMHIDELLSKISETHKDNTELVDMVYNMQSEMNYGIMGQVIRAEVMGLKKLGTRVFKPFNIDYYKGNK